MRFMEDETDERSPLLQFPDSSNSQQYASSNINAQFPGTATNQHDNAELVNAYTQFCRLIGNRPAELEASKPWNPPHETLYYRATHHRRMQGWIYIFTASLTNTLLLSQVVLGATLTGLGASDSSRVLITVFGALNTIIAGLVAFLKSRGQPMRARMFRDDLDRVVDEIENSATMWLGISRGLHGYDAYDTDEVTVRSEVARLTRLYDRAVKTNTMNDPDIYGAGLTTDPHSAALRNRPQTASGAQAVPATSTSGSNGAADQAAAAPIPAADPDESPATKAASPPKEGGKDAKKDGDKAADAKTAEDKGKQPQDGASSQKGDPVIAKPVSSDTPGASPATAEDPSKIIKEGEAGKSNAVGGTDGATDAHDGGDEAAADPQPAS